MILLVLNCELMEKSLPWFKKSPLKNSIQNNFISGDIILHCRHVAIVPFIRTRGRVA